MKAHLAKAVKWTASLAVVLTCIFAVGPKIESKLLPPYTRVSSALVSIDKAYVDVIVTGVKDRRCFLVSAIGESIIEGKTIMSQVTLLRADGTPLQIGEQRINVGAPFVRMARISPGADNVKVTIEAACHPFWTVSQVMVNIGHE